MYINEDTLMNKKDEFLKKKIKYIIITYNPNKKKR